MLQGTTEDTLLTDWFDSTAAGNIGLFKTVADSIDAYPDYAAALNVSITPENHQEENEQAVNVIYLSTWAASNFDLTDDEYEALYNIAIENAITGGSGVYAARVMLGLDIDDDPDGSSRFANLAVNENNNQQSLMTDVRVQLMPNPAKEQATYVINLNKNEKGKAELVTPLGIVNLSLNLQGGYNSKIIELRNLSSGVYLIKTTVNNKMTDVRKLIVLK